MKKYIVDTIDRKKINLLFKATNLNCTRNMFL